MRGSESSALRDVFEPRNWPGWGGLGEADREEQEHWEQSTNQNRAILARSALVTRVVREGAQGGKGAVCPSKSGRIGGDCC